jgi:hypothetical protein
MRADFAHAEEIKDEYNDFYGYNWAQYNTIYHTLDNRIDEIDEKDDDETAEQKRAEAAERNGKIATDTFEKWFGNRDIKESILVGFRPAYDDIQKILMEEHKKKTPVIESAMNKIAPFLRNLASVLLFAEKIVTALENDAEDEKKLDEIRAGFKKLLAAVIKGTAGEMPEFSREKKSIGKFKKHEQYYEVCEKLFGLVTL